MLEMYCTQVEVDIINSYPIQLLYSGCVLQEHSVDDYLSGTNFRQHGVAIYLVIVKICEECFEEHFLQYFEK